MLKDMAEAVNDPTAERVSDGVYLCSLGFVARVCLVYGYDVEGVIYGSCDSWEQAREFVSAAIDYKASHDIMLVTKVQERYPGEMGVYIGEKDKPGFAFSVISVSKEEQ